MRLHFNASGAHIGNRFPFLPVSLLIIDRNFPHSVSMPQYHINGFPRPGVAIYISPRLERSARARARFRYSIPAFRGFCRTEGERKREKERVERAPLT